MAKKKKRKEKKQAPSYSIELKGIFLILISIIGCCPFGIASSVIKGFAAFIAGAWYILPIIGVGLCGIYMIIKREKPDLLTSRLVGLYILIIGILILSHTEFIVKLNEKGTEFYSVLIETVNNIMGFVKGTNEIAGGGIIGAIFASAGVSLLTLEGTKVVCFALIICGIIMFTGISIYDAITSVKEKLNKAKEVKIDLKAAANVRFALAFTCTWLTPSIWFSTGSSTVMILVSSLLRYLKNVYNVVDLPQPVGPVSKTIP